MPTASNQSGIQRSWPSPWRAAGVCALAGFVVWQGFGNAVRGYIDTTSVFWWWGVQWFNPASETQHGPLILAVAVWLGGRNLRRHKVVGGGAEAAPVWPAGAAMLGGLGLHLLGYLVQQTRFSIVALLLFTWGVVRLGGGPRWGRAWAFPLALLLFAVPLEVLDAVGFHLRLGVIAVTEGLAHAVGVDVVRNGTQLFAPDGSYQYDVAAACSGVRSLLALLALAALQGYLGLRSPGRRAAVLALAFPLTFVGNVVRIAAIVLAGEWFGQRAGEVLHDWAGFVVFVVVLGGVQAATGWLARGEGASAATTLPTGAGAGVGAGGAAPARARRRVVALVAAVAAVTVGLVRAIDGLGVRAQAGVALAADGVNPAPLPEFVGTRWVGRETPVTAVERELLPPDTGYARRIYVAREDYRKQVLVSVVLSGRDRTSIHRPELCLVGQGWSIAGRRDTRFGDDSANPTPAALLQLERVVRGATGPSQPVGSLFAYWFVGRHEMATTTWARLVDTALNRLRLRPDRWAYVVVQTVIVPGETVAEARARMEDVSVPLLPQLTTR